MVEMLLNKFSLASDEQLHKGMRWYNDAHHICKRIAKYTKTPLYKVVGVMSALSPRNKWHRNISDTVCLIRKGKRAKVCTFNANKNKALKVLRANSPEEVFTLLNGRKIQSFYSNILHPFKADRVTVDVWAMRSVGIDKAPNKTEYNRVEEAYREVAKRLRIKPHEAQAIIWGVVRDAS